MKTINSKSENRNLKHAYISLGIFMLALIFVFFGYDILRIPKGIAYYNFPINVGFIFPLTGLSWLISLFVLVELLFQWKQWKKTKNKIISLAIAIPILILPFIVIVGVFRSH